MQDLPDGFGIGFARKDEMEQLVFLDGLIHREHRERQPDVFPLAVDAEETMRRIKDDFDAPNHIAPPGQSDRILVVRHQERIVAQTHLSFVLDSDYGVQPQCYILSFVVAPEFRDMGLGRALMHTVETLARRLGVVEVHADVWAGNTASEEFFSGQDFAPLHTSYRKTLA